MRRRVKIGRLVGNPFQERTKCRLFPQEREVAADTGQLSCVEQLRAAIPDFIPVSNPMDLTAQALVDPALYRRTLAPLIADDRFGSIVLGIIQTDEATSRLKFEPIIAAIEALKPSKPVIFAGLDDGAPVPQAA